MGAAARSRSHCAAGIAGERHLDRAEVGPSRAIVRCAGGADGCYIAIAKFDDELAQNMKQPIWIFAARALLVAVTAFSYAARADIELAGPDGRRILLKDNGTWLYVEGKEKDRTADQNKQEGEAVLVLERKVERGNGCGIDVRLENNLPYEISSLVPYYSVYRANGVIYDTVSAASSFTNLKPGDRQSREINFSGIACKDIVRVQVVGGDRCTMGDLDKFASVKGQCLARVRVVESNLVRFDK